MRRKFWTEEEIQFLEDHVGERTFTFIANKLDRTYDAVRKKAYSLGIGNPREVAGYFSAYAVSKILDVDMHVLYRWMRDYDFPVLVRNLSRQRTGRHKQYQYHVDPVKFWNWAEQHKPLLNFSKIEEGVLLPEPTWVREQRLHDYHHRPKRERQKWTSYEDNKLLQYNKLGWSFDEMSKNLNRSEKACSKRLEFLRKKGYEIRILRAQTSWSQQEVDTLSALRQQNLSWSEISATLSRSKGSVRDKWERLSKSSS